MVTKREAFRFRSWRILVTDMEDEPLVVTIASGEFGPHHYAVKENPPASRLVLSFNEIPQKLVVTPTMFTDITTITGEPDSDNWIGHEIEIYLDKYQQKDGRTAPLLRAHKPSEASGNLLPFLKGA